VKSKRFVVAHDRDRDIEKRVAGEIDSENYCMGHGTKTREHRAARGPLPTEKSATQPPHVQRYVTQAAITMHNTFES
jgi:hypothetical protein